MTYTFSPPARDEIARLTAADRARPNSPTTLLGRFLRVGTRPVNVFSLADGTFVESNPDPTTDAAIVRAYQGGTISEVSAAEAAALTAAGYTVTGWGVEPPPDDSTAGAGYGGGAFGTEAYGGDD